MNQRWLALSATVLGACGSASSNLAKLTSKIGGYDAAGAVNWAEDRTHDGDGSECAQFATDAAVYGGHLGITRTSYVPTLVDSMNYLFISYDEYTPSQTGVSACPGDIVVYSNASGDDFCVSGSKKHSERNCGHAGLVVTGGSGVGTIEGTFHNGVHHHLPLSELLDTSALGPTVSGYSTLRIYRLSDCTETGTPCSIPKGRPDALSPADDGTGTCGGDGSPAAHCGEAGDAECNGMACSPTDSTCGGKDAPCTDQENSSDCNGFLLCDGTKCFDDSSGGVGGPGDGSPAAHCGEAGDAECNGMACSPTDSTCGGKDAPCTDQENSSDCNGFLFCDGTKCFEDSSGGVGGPGDGSPAAHCGAAGDADCNGMACSPTDSTCGGKDAPCTDQENSSDCNGYLICNGSTCDDVPWDDGSGGGSTGGGDGTPGAHCGSTGDADCSDMACSPTDSTCGGMDAVCSDQANSGDCNGYLLCDGSTCFAEAE